MKKRPAVAGQGGRAKDNGPDNETKADEAIRKAVDHTFGVDPSTPGGDVVGTIPQALYMMNSPLVTRAVQAKPGTMLGKLLASAGSPREAVDALYLKTLARRPNPKELATCLHYLDIGPTAAKGSRTSSGAWSTPPSSSAGAEADVPVGAALGSFWKGGRTMFESNILRVAMNREGVIGRRSFLQGISLGGLGPGGLSFTDLMAVQADELRKRQMACILLWMSGGPSQLDTWDPKPGTETGGDARAIATAVPGIQVAHHFPRVAR